MYNLVFADLSQSLVDAVRQACSSNKVALNEMVSNRQLQPGRQNRFDPKRSYEERAMMFWRWLTAGNGADAQKLNQILPDTLRVNLPTMGSGEGWLSMRIHFRNYWRDSCVLVFLLSDSRKCGTSLQACKELQQCYLRL